MKTPGLINMLGQIHPTGFRGKMTSSLTRCLARALANPVDAPTRERAALHVLDWIGCAVAGAVKPAGQCFLRQAAERSAGPLSVIGGAGLASPEQVAFCNGGLGNILEMDDIHRNAILHPGPVVIPAALAAAEASKSSAATFLDAVVRGYEAMIRIGEAVGPGHYAIWHNTSTCGPFGAAAAVGSILNLNEDRFVWALGNAGTQASGPWRCRHEPVMTKHLHTAQATEAGYNAAALAAIGFSGPEFMLEGQQGFFQAMCPDPLPDRVSAPFEGEWKIWETGFKPWPACRHAHAAIDAALELKETHDPDPRQISRIRVHTYRDARIFCDKRVPTTVLEAKFSIQHSVAMSLLEGAPALSAFAADTLNRREVASLRDRTTVAVSEDIDQRYPEHYGSGVDLDLDDGRTLSTTVTDALGDPENPLPEARVISKARQLMETAALQPGTVASVADAVLALSNGGSLSALSELLSDFSAQLEWDRVA